MVTSPSDSRARNASRSGCAVRPNSRMSSAWEYSLPEGMVRSNNPCKMVLYAFSARFVSTSTLRGVSATVDRFLDFNDVLRMICAHPPRAGPRPAPGVAAAHSCHRPYRKYQERANKDAGAGGDKQQGVVVFRRAQQGGRQDGAQDLRNIDRRCQDAQVLSRRVIA